MIYWIKIVDSETSETLYSYFADCVNDFYAEKRELAEKNFAKFCRQEVGDRELMQAFLVKFGISSVDMQEAFRNGLKDLALCERESGGFNAHGEITVRAFSQRVKMRLEASF
jgi:hypothetical protein